MELTNYKWWEQEEIDIEHAKALLRDPRSARDAKNFLSKEDFAEIQDATIDALFAHANISRKPKLRMYHCAE